MSKQRSKRRPQQPKPLRPARGASDPHEERSAKAITVAWAASVTSVFVVDLVTIAAHFYARGNPESKIAPLFEAIMLLTGCLIGIASLALLVVVGRTSRLKPPQGFVIFALLVAMAPIIALGARLLTSVSPG